MADALQSKTVELKDKQVQEQVVTGASAGDTSDGAGAEGEEEFAEEAMEEPEGYIPPADEDTTSIMSIVPNDHDRIKGLYRRYKDPIDTTQQQELLAVQLLRELAVHMLAEEEVLYPTVANEVDDHMRDHAIDEHDSLKLFSSDLESMKPGDEGYEDKMHQLMETFLEHIHEEEHKVLPALREVLDEPQLRELGKRFEAAKQHVPTRPRPDMRQSSPMDDAVVLRDTAKDDAQLGATAQAMTDHSTEVTKNDIQDEPPAVI